MLPDEIDLTAFAADLTDLAPDDLRELFASVPLSTVAAVFASLPLGEDAPNKRLAIELSELLTYEQGQQLYRFSVFVTKLI